jgi:phage/plasmid-like protein (TIGR03299 family)
VNNRNVGVKSLEICLLALAGGDCLIEIIADVLPRTGAVSERIAQEIGTSETGGAAPTTEIEVPGEIRLIGDDICSKYLLLSNAHDGRGSVSVKFTPIRVVCQNTLMLALESGEKAHTIRHSKHMQDRLQNVQELLGLIWKTFEKAQELFQFLAKVQVNAERLDTYLEAVYPRTEDQCKAKKRPERWNRVAQLFEIGDSPDLRPSHTHAIRKHEDSRPLLATNPGPKPAGFPLGSLE